MSAQRADSMAVIDNALTTGNATASAEPADADVVNGPDAALTNPIAPPPPDADDKEKEDDEKEDKEPEDKTGQQVDALTGAAKSTFETKHPMGLDFFKFQNLAINLNKLPDPGGFMFPLILLLVCFFILIPVNGHTRIVWLWMVITGSAEIQGSGGTLPGGTPPPGNGQSNPSVTPPGPVQPTVEPPPMGSIGTMVEEL